MYGTISRSRVKPGMRDEALRYWNERMPELPPGAVGLFVYQSDADPNEVWIASIFESKEAYQANAASPEQTRRFEEGRRFAEGPPEWHDGEIVFGRCRDVS